MTRACRLATILIAGCVTAAPVDARQAPAVARPAEASATPGDYARDESWLCRPGREDACAIDLTTMVVAADGTTTREAWAGNPRAPIDCFYVYPTVSRDPSTYSDMTMGEEERNVVRQQLARFGSQCRLFAPMYRQVTLRGLRERLAGSGLELNRGSGYDDVRAAWNHYLTRDNSGRGVVLIGHSQGAMVLTRLIREEIDGQPVHRRLVSAILLGTSLPVPKGMDVGGAFQRVPLCRAADQIGCVITYASFRSTLPPPANTRFGRVQEEGMEAGCTNPAALAGGSGPLHAYLTNRGSLIAQSAPQSPRWTADGAAIETPFVSVPGLLSARCASNEHATFLEVTVEADPADARADDIPGDLGGPGRVQADWGLHLVDVNIAMGNLVNIVGRQAKAYLAKARR
ncbi:MAG: DUF3089 domain-containing protein [Vicinamibacterales bacterium]